MDLRQCLQQVLAGQNFPADCRKLIATAEVYGPDLVTRSELQARAGPRGMALGAGVPGAVLGGLIFLSCLIIHCISDIFISV
jgi:hypothetical protein